MSGRAWNPINPLRINQKFLSYLERHRIFELLQELSMMLVVKKPEDHLLFIKQSLYHAARRLDVPRIIILGPPEFDRLRFTEHLAEKLQIPLISMKDIAKDAELALSSEPSFFLHLLRTNLAKHMQMNSDGWMFSDFPRTEQEARILQRGGITPSHVFDVVLDTKDNLSISNAYRKEIRGLRHVFAELITTINAGNKKIGEIIQECLDSVKLRKFVRAPTVFRILLLDSTDSGRNDCLAEHLSEIFNIVHIDFTRVLERISLQETELSVKLRDAKMRADCSTDLVSQLKIQVLEEFLMQNECLRKGWVLTGLPTTVDDFKHLDMMDTPPNRVIVLVPPETQNDACDDADNSSSENTCCASLYACVCVSKQSMSEMLKYAGESASLIESDVDVKRVKERIALSLVKPAPCVPPRQPRPPPVVRPECVEYDPDDEPNIDIYYGIRECEPILPLV